jgi:four helix bundle protein
MRIEKFEDIKAWQEARALAKYVYLISSQKNFQQDFSLGDQIRRASTSVMANIAEGFGRQGKAEFQRFLKLPGLQR